jgi:cell division protein FtsB
MVNGSNGFLNLVRLNKEFQNLQTSYNILEQEKKFLLIKNKGLYDASLNLDILEEESKKLGYANGDEIIILTTEE